MTHALTTDAQITIRYNDRAGEYTFTPDGVREALVAITGAVDPGAWAHAVGAAHKQGGMLTLAALASSIVADNERLIAAMAKRGIRRVMCDCGHECASTLVMSAARGTSCPDCYDRMS